MCADHAKNDTASAWHGASRIVDAAGEPLLLYHGGKAGIAVFGENYRETLEWAAQTRFKLSDIERLTYENPVFFFTDDEGVAEGYADQYERDEQQVYEVHLRIERPLDLRPRAVGLEVAMERLGRVAQRDVSQMRDMHPCDADRAVSHVMRSLHHLLKGRCAAMGHDGIIMPDTDVRDRAMHTSFVVFEPGQIRILNAPSAAPEPGASVGYGR